MPSYNSGNLIAGLRARKRWKYGEVLSGVDFHDGSLSRIVNNHRSPNLKNFHAIMESMQIPVETFLYPFLEKQSIKLVHMRESIQYYLSFADEDPTAITKLSRLLAEMESSEYFNSGINKQFLLRCKAQFNEICKNDPGDTIKLVNNGMMITYPEFDECSFESYILILEETSLLHAKALAYHRLGEADKAIELLNRLINGLEKTPQDDRDKERIMAPLLLSLSKFYIKAGLHKIALTVSNKGLVTSLKRNRGFYNPDFAFQIVCCLYHLKQTDKVTSLIKQSFFGFALMRRYRAAEKVLRYAHEELNIRFEAYGIEFQKYGIPEPTLTYEKPYKCGSIGQLIAFFRTEAGLTLNELSYKICSYSNLQKIEAGDIRGRFYHLEAIMQRLGRDIDRYFNTFLSHEDFKDKQLRDEINSRLVKCEYREAETLLSKLCERKAYKSGVNKQFIDLAKVEIAISKVDYGLEHIPLLKAILSFDSDDIEFGIIAKTRLTYYDVIAINQMAVCYCSSGNKSLGLQIFEDLKKSMDRYSIDESLKAIMYMGVLFNYSKFLGLAYQYDEALQIAQLGIYLCIKHNNLIPLPGLMFNYACALYFTDNKEDCLPFFAQAYYSFILIGKLNDAKVAKLFVLENYGIVYD
jgi:transcriptional regulator with XRE-family HTH domain